MPTLIDTSLWIDFTRARSPTTIKRFIAPYILDRDAHLAGPITFELLRHATVSETKQLIQQFGDVADAGHAAAALDAGGRVGPGVSAKNIAVGSLDLLIAMIAIHHGAEIVTFDGDFQKIASASNLHVNLLQRPTI